MKKSFHIVTSVFLSILIIVTMAGMVFVHYTCPKCAAMHNAMEVCVINEDLVGDDDCAECSTESPIAGQHLSMPCHTLKVIQSSVPTVQVQQHTIPAPVLMALLQAIIGSSSSELMALPQRAAYSEKPPCALLPREYLSHYCTLLI